MQSSEEDRVLVFNITIVLASNYSLPCTLSRGVRSGLPIPGSGWMAE